MNSIQKTARIAGLLYLIFMACLIIATTVRSQLIVPGDAAATARNIVASEWLFRASFVTELLSAVFFLLAAWALYVLLKPTNSDLALLFVLLNAGGVAVQSISILNQITALQLLGGAGYLNVFRTEQLQAWAMLSLNSYTNGFMIAELFYGTWLLPLGCLVYKSGLLPRVLGVLLIVDFAGILFRFFQFFLLPGHDTIAYPGLVASLVAEFSLSLWLLIMGVKTKGVKDQKQDD